MGMTGNFITGEVEREPRGILSQLFADAHTPAEQAEKLEGYKGLINKSNEEVDKGETWFSHQANPNGGADWKIRAP